MEEIIAFIVFLLAVVILCIIVAKILKSEKEDKKTNERAKEERLREQKLEEEFEINLKTKCIICDDYSFGKIICQRCKERKTIFEKDLNLNQFEKYEYAHQYRAEMISSIIEAKHGFQKEADSLKLLAIDERLEGKFKDRIKNQDISLLKDIHDGMNKKEILEKYEIELTEKRSYNAGDPNVNDYRKKYKKDFRCKDGHYVGSKSEREIDNFFFDNHIRHCYEESYRHPQTGKTALPDFYLPDYNLYIEYFGMSTEEYIRDREEKIDMYRSDKSINFTYLTYKDDNLIYEKLKDKCKEYSIPVK